ncbi:uncharacterized protein LOC125149857 [Prionailurus viverrinus]|uniref:uncharacterized protein LOC125149857 n=1 Tax=Prionailurus viverrinus TaxID=61388 RepID=UPI001FF62B47|nr:uncharacterized protein LOC125149857 [Prionailurus viverrinus]
MRTPSEARTTSVRTLRRRAQPRQRDEESHFQSLNPVPRAAQAADKAERSVPRSQILPRAFPGLYPARSRSTRLGRGSRRLPPGRGGPALLPRDIRPDRRKRADACCGPHHFGGPSPGSSVTFARFEQAVPDERGPIKLLPCELRSAPQHQATVALDCVCEHLCLYLDLFGASISKMCPRVLEKPKRSCILGLGTLKNFSTENNDSLSPVAEACS